MMVRFWRGKRKRATSRREMARSQDRCAAFPDRSYGPSPSRPMILVSTALARCCAPAAGTVPVTIG